MRQLIVSGSQSIGASVSVSTSPSNEYSSLISFRIDWFDLLAVQGTIRSLLHHNLKVSILWCSIFFMVQLSYSYMTTGKTIALTRWTFVGKVMSQLIITLSQFSLFQLLSCVRIFTTPWTTSCQASLSITNSWSLLILMSIKLVMPSNHLILGCPLLLLPSIFPSIRVFVKALSLRY